MDVHEVYPDTDFLKCEDLNGAAHTLIIGDVETIQYDDGNKLKIAFQDTDRIFVANKTNSLIISEHHGPNTDHWYGKSITLYPTKVSFGAKMVPAIRVKEPEAPLAQAGAGLGQQPQDGVTSPHPNEPGQERSGDPGIGSPSKTTKRPL